MAAMWRSSPLLFCAAALTLLTTMTVTVESARTNEPFYVIAHMANSKYSVDWALTQGANAMEADIQFDGSGFPTKFEHRGFCDCSCPHPSKYHICNKALKGCSGSRASNGAKEHLIHLSRNPKVALIILDGKVDPKWGSRLATAGWNLVNLVDRYLFNFGYKGKVVISAGKINCYEYLRAAANRASTSKYRNKYYFSFDQESNNYHNVAAMLSRFTKNRVFGTGISSCVPGNYKSGISQAVNGIRNGEIGMSYIWTLDKESSMMTYIDLGVQGIITNRPALLWSAVLTKKVRYASSSSSLPVARVNVPSPYKCDCDYHKGGCVISFPAPPNKACKCKYKGWWTCGGSVVNCFSRDDACGFPGASLASCKMGHGDCGGYR